MITIGDLYAELDKAISAVNKEQREDRPLYDPAYLHGIRDGLYGFRLYVRSQAFVSSIKRGSTNNAR